MCRSHPFKSVHVCLLQIDDLLCKRKVDNQILDGNGWLAGAHGVTVMLGSIIAFRVRGRMPQSRRRPIFWSGLFFEKADCGAPQASHLASLKQLFFRVQVYFFRLFFRAPSTHARSAAAARPLHAAIAAAALSPRPPPPTRSLPAKLRAALAHPTSSDVVESAEMLRACWLPCACVRASQNKKPTTSRRAMASNDNSVRQQRPHAVLVGRP